MDPSREPTVNLLCSKDFHPEKYVRDLSQSCVGGPELRRLRKKIQALSEETNNNLKKNVYHNYTQFIDTAKEISHLESEMYQLSHLLSEQKSLLSSLATTSILGDDTCLKSEIETKEANNNDNNSSRDDDQENKNKIATILEKVENCEELLEITNRKYLYEGDLLEIDPIDNNIIKTVHAYLFTDSFMITYRNTNNRSLMKYVFEVMYDLGSLAVVNVRDMGNTKHAFKLLIFPDTRVFQCTSSSNKKEWLDKFDQAKKSRLAQEQQKRESIVEKSPSRAASIDSPSINPFEEYEEETATIHPEWFLEIPEELDVCIAQRHFEDALILLQKSKDYINNNQQQFDQILIDIHRKIEQRRNNLIDVLIKELELNPDKSLQGGLRATRRTIRLLNQLNCSQQSSELFLKLCSSMLKQQCKRVKREGSTFIYIKYLSSVVFTNLCHMTEEFLKAFQNSSTCLSAYIVWINSELSLFIAHLIKQVFMPQTSLSTITDCVVLVREQCERLCTYGVDLCYQLDGMLRTPLIQSLKDARDKLVDSIKVRSIEDKWIPMNLRTKTNLIKSLNEYSQLGLVLNGYISGDVWLELTVNTLSFTKLYLQLLDDCLKLQTIELLYVIDDILYDVFETQIKHIEQSLRNEKLSEQRQFMTKNAEFLLITLIELSQKKYKEIISFECRSLEKLQKEYQALTKGITPTTRNITKKYSSEFL